MLQIGSPKATPIGVFVKKPAGMPACTRYMVMQQEVGVMESDGKTDFVLATQTAAEQSSASQPAR